MSVSPVFSFYRAVCNSATSILIVIKLRPNIERKLKRMPEDYRSLNKRQSEGLVDQFDSFSSRQPNPNGGGRHRCHASPVLTLRTSDTEHYSDTRPTTLPKSVNSSIPAGRARPQLTASLGGPVLSHFPSCDLFGNISIVSGQILVYIFH